MGGGLLIETLKSSLSALILLLCLPGILYSQQTIIEADSTVLVDLYQATNGDNWTFSNGWLTTNPATGWHGVSVDANDKTVSNIQLFFNNLTGELPASLADLESPEILNFASNGLAGEIPDLSSLTTLQRLDLGGNQLSGEIPTSLGDLINLVDLYLNSNQLTGPIPSALNSLEKLEILALSDNGLTGIINLNFNNLPNLITLQLATNHFTGAIPVTLANLTNLVIVDLRENALQGAVPQILPARFLYLQDNQLSDLPDFSGSQLQELHVAGNRFDFDDLEPNAGVTGFKYWPQDSVETTVELLGSQARLSVNVGGTATTYAWYRNDVQIQGATEKELLVDAMDDGQFRCVASNGSLPFLRLFSRPVRLTPAETIVINSTSDAGLDPPNRTDVCTTGDTIMRDGVPEAECTLRAALEFVENTRRAEVTNIIFDIPTSSPPTIQPGAPLPKINYPIILNASTQPGAGFAVLDGSLAGEAANGLVVEGGKSIFIGLNITEFKGNGIQLNNNSSNHVENCVITRNQHGIKIVNSDFNQVRDNVISDNLLDGISAVNCHSSLFANNRIGTNLAGTARLGNGNFVGISLLNAVEDTLRDNVISGNRIGISLSSTDNTLTSAGNVIEHNKIGTNIDGTNTIANHSIGILIRYTRDTSIKHNTIAGNGSQPEEDEDEDISGGIEIGGLSTAILIEENSIGGALVNSGYGIVLTDGAHHNTLRNNVISNNALTGVLIRRDRNGIPPHHNTITDNRIGVDITGANALGNGKYGISLFGVDFCTISNNVISGNGATGITLFSSGYNQILNNKIGTDISGLQSIGNLNNGISLSLSYLTEIRDNLIAANAGHGVSLAFCALVDIIHNQIGTDIDGQNSSGNMGNFEDGLNMLSQSSSSIEDNAIANHERGVYLEKVFDSAVFDNEIFSNAIGLSVFQGKPTVQGNHIFDNQSGLVITEAEEDILIANNEIEENTGDGTGLHLYQSKAIVCGNQIREDRGDAIILESGSIAKINSNNIFENQGFGLNNLEPSNTVDARSNWWGDASGPGGVGTGSGNPVSAGVDFSNWRFRPASVVVSAESDTLFLPTGESDTVLVFLQNWVDRGDVLDISIVTSRNWLDSSTEFSVPLADNRGALASLAVTIPAGTPDSTDSFIELTATSQADDFNFAKTGVVIFSQNARLSFINVSPDSLILSPGDTVVFVATGFDQFNRVVDFSPVWSASDGSIDSDGLFLAPFETKTVVVTATDPSGTITGQAIVVVQPVTSVGETPLVIPTTFQVFQNYPNPFNPTTTIRYDLPVGEHVTIAIFDIRGRKVRNLVDEFRAAGSYSVVWDGQDDRGLAVASGLYFYRLRSQKLIQVRKMLLIK